MSNTVLYLDSSDALSAGFETSSDYAYCFMARMPLLSEEDLAAEPSSDDSINMFLSKYLYEKDAVSLVITDILYYRFILSVSSLFSVQGQQDVAGLIITSAQVVYESMSRDDVLSLLDTPNVSSIEKLLDLIQVTAEAQDEILSIKLKAKAREIQIGLYGTDSESIIKNFPKDSSRVISFSLMTSRQEFSRLPSGAREILTCHYNTQISSLLKEENIIESEPRYFKPMNDFCLAICTIFSAILIQGDEDKELDDVYKRIWSFILKTRSSCFLPNQAYNKTRTLLQR